jgi:hypothetical protein
LAGSSMNTGELHERIYAPLRASHATIPSRRSLAAGDVNLRPGTSTVVRHGPMADPREGGLPDGGPWSAATSQRLPA